MAIALTPRKGTCSCSVAMVNPTMEGLEDHLRLLRVREALALQWLAQLWRGWKITAYITMLCYERYSH